MFFITAMVYPASVIITHFVQDHYSLSGFFTNYPWSLHPNGYFAPPKLEDYLRRLWFIPFCWVISLGPPVAYITIKEIILSGIKNKGILWCVLVFWTFFILTEISAFKGSIILETRFSATVTLLSLPFCAVYFKELTMQKARLAILFGALTIGLTFVYNFQNITAVPRLANQNGNKVAEIVGKSINPESGLIIDFWEWENPGYIGLQSKLPSSSVYILSGDDKNTVQAKEINEIIQNHQQGIILLVKNSVLWQNAIISDKNLQFKFNNLSLNTQTIYSDNEVEVWKYSR
ncbi:MAG TPA: hypothetical protein VK809_01720 [Bacteroidia bacterium]|nr:hypothetical protein [Bacteroidia bacterium]